MQKHFISIILVVIIAISLPSLSRAQTLMETEAATGIGATVEGQSVAPGIRDRIRADYEIKIQNMRANQEVREEMIQNREGNISPRPINSKEINIRERAREMSSTTPPKMPLFASSTSREQIREQIENRLENGRLASSTRIRQELRAEYRDEGRAMVLNIFKERKEHITDQLKTANENLENVRARIASRIEKEQANGHDLSEALSLMETAKLKMTTASNAIQALKNYVPNQTDTASSSPSEIKVNLDTVRTLIDNAQKSVREARQALNDVVVSIAKSMGLKLGQNPTASPAADNQ